MYERHFGLRERPFDLTPNPRFLFLTPRYREALSNLQYGVTGRKGVTLLVGEAGTGKTTLVRAAIGAIDGSHVRCVYLNNPVLTRSEFYQDLAPKFGLSERAGFSKALFLAELEERLTARHAAGGTTALIIDEAQSLPHELMEEVRLLANCETATEKLLAVVLAGQPELANRLEHDDLRQLKQRVALRCELLPFDVRETAAYIAGRISIAGGEAARTFTREAVRLVYDCSLGIPRTISVICDNAMVTAFAAREKPVSSATVEAVCRDFNLGQTQQAADDERLLPSASRGFPEPSRPRTEARDAGATSPSGGGRTQVMVPAAASAAPAASLQAPSPESGAGLDSAVEAEGGRRQPLFGAFSRKRLFFF
jgi:general secretion pathway protein A